MLFELGEETLSHNEAFTDFDIPSSTGLGTIGWQSNCLGFSDSVELPTLSRGTEDQAQSLRRSGTDSPNILSSSNSGGFGGDLAPSVEHGLFSYNEFLPTFGFDESLPRLSKPLPTSEALEARDSLPSSEPDSWSFDLPQVPHSFLSGFSLAESETDPTIFTSESSDIIESATISTTSASSVDWTCSECSRQFQKRHLLTYVEVLSCLAQTDNLNSKHMRCHNKPFECRSCSVRFALQKDLRRHAAAHDANPFFCPVADCKYAERGLGKQSGFRRKDNLRRHMRIHKNE